MLKLRKNILKSQGGFTLIEMVIVIAIIGVLIALLLPNLMGFLDSAKQKACDANVKMLQGAVTGYIAAGNDEDTVTESTTTVINQQVLIDGNFIVEAVECPLGTKTYHYSDGKVYAE